MDMPKRNDSQYKQNQASSHIGKKSRVGLQHARQTSVWLLSILLLCLATADGKPPVKPAMPSPIIWAELSHAQSQPLSPFQLAQEFPDKQWWQTFHDPNLESYILAALSANPDLQNAVLRISEAQALMRQQRAIQFPSVALQSNYIHQHTGSAALGTNTSNLVSSNSSSSVNQIPTISSAGLTYSIYSVPIVASYQMDLWGKNYLLTKSAKKVVEEQRQAARAIALTLVTNVASAYFNLLKADSQIQVLNDLVTNTQQSLDIQQQLFQTGITPYDPMLLTAENLASYQQTLIQYQGQQGIYAHQLMVLTGRNPKAYTDIPRLSLDALQFPSSIPVGIPGELVTHRPDIVQNEIALEKADIDVREARREFLPTLTLTGSFGFASRELDQLFNWKNHAASLIGQAGQSLFTGGAKTAYLQLQKVRAQEQLRIYQSTLLHAYQQVEDSLSSLKADYSGYQTNLQEIEISKHAVTLNETRFRQGISPKLDWLTAQRQLLTFQQVAQQNKANSLIDLVSLYGALGGGYTP